VDNASPSQFDRDIDQSEEFQIIYRVDDLIHCPLSDVSGIAARHDDLPEASAADKKMQDGDAHAASIPGDLQLCVHYVGKPLSPQRVSDDALELPDAP
jgi:hypothetical protein